MNSLGIGLAWTLLLQNPSSSGVRLEPVAVLPTGGPGAEILSVQAATARAALTHSQDGTVELLDLADPAHPRSLRVLALGLAKGEEITSVAFHPSGDWFLAAVKADRHLAPGRAIACSTQGSLLASFPCGVGPDCVVIAPSGKQALVANEAEGFDEVGDELLSAPGSLTRIEIAEDLARSSVTQIPLTADSPAPTDERTLERQVDGETQEVALGAGPEFLEPEVVLFLPDERRALVSLEESNLVAFVELVPPALGRLVPLGNASHPADLVDDGRFEETGTLLARREPDGIALTPDGRYFLTADEGDTYPSVHKTPPGKPAGGGRTLSVFELATGAFVGDTGPELDRAAAKAGLYPDKRSLKRGSEPEMVLTFERGGRPYAALTLERAGALALVDLFDPKHPSVVALAPTGKDNLKDEPEGLALFRDPSGEADYLYVANEGTGTLGVLRVPR